MSMDAHEYFCTVHHNHKAHEPSRSEEHTSELQSLRHIVCRLLLEKIEPDVRAAGNFGGRAQRTAGMPEHAVDSEPPGFVAGNILRFFLRSPPPRSIPSFPARLLRR